MQRLVEEAVRVAGQIRTPEKVCEFDVKGWEEELVKLFTTYTHLRRLLILRYLSAHGGTPIATLAEKIGMSPDAAYRHLDKLLRRGVVVCIGKAPAHWGVAPVSGDVWRTKLLALVLREFKSYRTTTAA
jgi:DNA-binding transcriptional ArsR family regulator